MNNPREKKNQKDNPNKGEKQKRPPLYNYAYYMGIGFRILGSVLGGVLIGYLIDNSMNNERHYFTLAFSVLALVAMMYQLIKEFS